MFVEFTEANDDKSPLLVNPDDVSVVVDEKTHRSVFVKSGRNWWVTESYQEVKKRLGNPITPRAETIAA